MTWEPFQREFVTICARKVTPPLSFTWACQDVYVTLDPLRPIIAYMRHTCQVNWDRVINFIDISEA